MTQVSNSKPNIRQAVPFFWVSDMEKSIRYYVNGLGFELSNQWTDDGKLQWCWLQHGNAALMLQEFKKESPYAELLQGSLGKGVSVCFICEDALAIYQEITAKGIQTPEPFVGNGMWVVSLTDPDGYRIDFESATDVPEETKLSDWKSK